MSGTSGAIAFVGGTLMDGNGGAPVPGATVVVESDRIVATGPSRSVAVPGDARLIDVRGKTVMPGLIDVHIHISDDFDPDPALRLRGLPESARSAASRPRDASSMQASPRHARPPGLGTRASPSSSRSIAGSCQGRGSSPPDR
jgi:imidazolonepropionase-like amidohydrolase